MLNRVCALTVILLALPALAPVALANKNPALEASPHVHSPSAATVQTRRHPLENEIPAVASSVDAPKPSRRDELQAIITMCNQREKIQEITQNSPYFTSAPLPSKDACDNAVRELRRLDNAPTPSTILGGEPQPDVKPQPPAAPVQ